MRSLKRLESQNVRVEVSRECCLECCWFSRCLTLTSCYSDDQWIWCQDIASKLHSKVLLEIDVEDDGSLALSTLAARRRRPAVSVSTDQHEKRQSLGAESGSWDLGEPFHYIDNAKQWLSQLRLLRYLEEQKSTVLVIVSEQEHLHSDASKSLQEFIKRLQASIKVLSQKDALWQAARRLRPLWKELKRATGDVALLNDVKKRVDRNQRGIVATRSSRRAAFKRSPYSHKSHKFKAAFTSGNPPILHEPQLAPLSDEVSSMEGTLKWNGADMSKSPQDSEDEDFTREESDKESSDAYSETSSLEDSSDDDEDSDDDEVDGEQEPPLKRLKVNDGSATVLRVGGLPNLQLLRPLPALHRSHQRKEKKKGSLPATTAKSRSL